MKEYKVLVACDVNGTARAVNDIVSASDEVAAPLVASGNLEAVTVDIEVKEAAAPADTEKSAEVAGGDQGAATAAPAPRLVTEEDLAANPILVELNAVIGDVVSLTHAA